MGLISSALCNVNEVIRYLGLKQTDDIDVIEDIINGISTAIITHCGRNFLSAEYTEYHDGGTDRIYVEQYPITSLSGVWLDDEEVTDVAISDNQRYIISDYDLYTSDYDEENVKVIYTAGYTTIPSDVRLVAIMECAKTWKRRKQLDVSAISMQDGSITMLTDDWLPTTKKVLSSYTKRRLI